MLKTRWSRPRHHMEQERRLPLAKQLLLQLFCLAVAAVVLFPIMWVVTMSLDPRNLARPSELRLIPQDASLQAYRDVLDQPTANPIKFWQLAANSFKLAGGVAFFSVLLGVHAAYIFSRFRFRGREPLMLSVIFVLIMPPIATIAPLFVLLNSVRLSSGLLQLAQLLLGGAVLTVTAALVQSRLRDRQWRWATLAIALGGLLVGGLLARQGLSGGGERAFVLRNSLPGVGLAMISSALPFAIWNLKGYLDTIPKELEEAAVIDGAGPSQVFWYIILPLATPALAVTAFLGFMTGWTEFALSWQFLTNVEDFTLSMALWNMTGQYAGSVPWSKFAAMSIVVALPVSLVYFLLQRYIVSGLTIGGVKG